MSTAASAPGKVILSGEYVVLDGAPAVCMAVDRRARAVVSNIRGPVSQVEAPGFSNVVGHFQTTHGQIEWLDGEEVFKLVTAVLQAGHKRPDSSLDIMLETDAFKDVNSGLKIGIGSSAALTVALSAAVAGSLDVGETARIAHKILQSGSGSGVDIACSMHGGLIRFCLAGAGVMKLEWPDDLQFRLIWTGIAASTVDKLAQFDACVQKPSRAALRSAAESIATAWAEGDTGRIIENTAEYVERLRTFDEDHKLGIFDAGHDSLLAAARAVNLVYKPCGAGGGDVGIVLGRDGPELDAFVAALPLHFSVVDCALDAGGIKIDENMSQ